jgi:hypothetical protein
MKPMSASTRGSSAPRPSAAPVGSGHLCRRTVAAMSATEPRHCRPPADIEGNIRRYLGDRNPTARYASFDYCFNYFQAFRERDDVKSIAADDHRQLSCLQLGFYLASWGMLRGSTDLLQRSVKHLVPLIETIADAAMRPNDSCPSATSRASSRWSRQQVMNGSAPSS